MAACCIRGFTSNNRNDSIKWFCFTCIVHGKLLLIVMYFPFSSFVVLSQKVPELSFILYLFSASQGYQRRTSPKIVAKTKVIYPERKDGYESNIINDTIVPNFVGTVYIGIPFAVIQDSGCRPFESLRCSSTDYS